MKAEASRHPLNGSAIIAIVLVLTLSGCTLRDFEVRGVSISGLDGLGRGQATVQVDLHLHNPNPYRIAITEDRMGLWLMEDSVGTISFATGSSLPRKEDSVLPMTATLDVNRVNGVIASQLVQIMFTGLHLRVKGTVTGKAWGTSRTIDVDHTERVRFNQGG